VIIYGGNLIVKQDPVSIAAGVPSGDVIVDGGHVVEIGGIYKLAVPDPVDRTRRVLYSPASPECWFEDFGKEHLTNGFKNISLDPEFVRLADTTAVYHVFLTPRGDSNGLYVDELNVDSFTVREQQGGTSQVEFSYRVVAKRKDVSPPRWPKLEDSLAVPKPTTTIKERKIAGRRD